WEPGGDKAKPANVPASELRWAVARVAAAALLGRCWPDGSRHDAALALAGGLLRSGWSVADAERFVEAVAAAAHDAEVRDRVRAVRDTARDIEAGRPVTGWKRLGKLLGGADLVSKVREWLGIEIRAAEGEASVRPEIIVRDELSAVCDEAEAALAA